MESLLGELIKQSPIAAAFIVMVWLFLRAEEKREARRVQTDKKLEESRVVNAKALELERREHEREINNMWANFMKTLIDQQNKNFTAVVHEIHEHEDRAQKRYERLNITRDLKKAARSKLSSNN